MPWKKLSPFEYQSMNSVTSRTSASTAMRRSTIFT
jgi:hypothetical protein